MARLLDPAVLLPLLDRLFWLMAFLAVGWFTLFVLRSVSTKAAPFWEGFQALFGWSTAAVAFVWVILLLGVVTWWASYITGWTLP